MPSKFIESFPSSYRDITMSHNVRENIKKYNNNLKKYKYVLAYPFSNTEQAQQEHLLIGFSNEAKVFACGKETAKEAFSHLQQNEILNINVPDTAFTESFTFETSLFEPIPIEKIHWKQFIEAKKIEDGDFSDLQTSFLTYFGLEENEYNQDYTDSFSFGSFFCKKENKPDELELRVVWKDVDRDEKYGTIETLMFWKNDFIGWIRQSGRWLETETISTVDIEKLKDLMQNIYDKTGFIRSNRLHGISIYDMDKYDVDDVVSVPGVSMRNYSEED